MTTNHHTGPAVPEEHLRSGTRPEVQSISDAGSSQSVEIHQRMVKYALAMGIRIVCLILIFVVDGWFKIIVVAGAVFIPWFAVILANGSDQSEFHSDTLLDAAPLNQIEAAPEPGTAEPEGPLILQGELVDEDSFEDEPHDGRSEQADDDPTNDPTTVRKFPQ
ncbi:DUF3099 domain-containing protein [Pseudarthrobacter sp. PS3-L1]|uniref:DUF3099 domain-containing protein n=1 Tax=Pseudarthrobacter sp. PS3-L1 TaxID=3046207 RepID=UPI0024B9EB84|nr:DUF3099 domain-containing protein [Pseudarthrobacter sp. PS3-L1]MDJ0320195.1 DUF3099 domain-containing protein [Pseudarthrobacter sp. PS3-L1]